MDSIRVDTWTCEGVGCTCLLKEGTTYTIHQNYMVQDIKTGPADGTETVLDWTAVGATDNNEGTTFVANANCFAAISNVDKSMNSGGIAIETSKIESLKADLGKWNVGQVTDFSEMFAWIPCGSKCEHNIPKNVDDPQTDPR